MTSPRAQATIRLGVEHDKKLREAVRYVLREFGGVPTRKSWVMGGSQELETFEVEVRSISVLVEAETFIGLSITGDPEFVESITARVHERIAASPA